MRWVPTDVFFTLGWAIGFFGAATGHELVSVLLALAITTGVVLSSLLHDQKARR